MKINVLLILLFSVITTGCAMGPMPQNALEYRTQTLTGSAGSSFKTYVVNHPYKKVVSTIKSKAKKCLNTNVERNMCGGPYGQGCSSQTITYKSTFIEGKNKSELHVQWDMTKMMRLGGGAPPKDGMYIAVFDFVKSGKNKTIVKEYAIDIEGRTYYRVAPKAVKHWANRTNMGCPDLTGDIYK